ncbi:MAG: hypothetical protein A2017_11045 [Lentisphaerae bacterium GWF2_44_16]|nr:MAG: hypothetical protein A2017_11045 [Lentisphaerae bacterium GWF2_44_16]
MSKDNMKRFLEELEKNLELRKEFERILDESHGKTLEAVTAKLIAFAKSAGFDCSAEDFAGAVRKSDELSDEDMRKAAGGGLDSEFARNVRNWLFDIFNRRS